nr:EOG090X0F6V [Triops cancriformis]
MTDEYKEEQLGEIFTLQSIYPDEINILEEKPFHRFTVDLKSEGYNEEAEEGYACKLEVTYTPTYPNDPPEFDVTDTVGMDDEQTERLKEHIQTQVEESLGMVMVFTMVSAANEWLSVAWEEEVKRREEEIERKKVEAEEAEKVRFVGTPVTVENFLSWKERFEAEMSVLKKPEKEDKDRKLTGRELFMRDKSLIDSDLKFLEEGGDAVKVDESLFQDLDDLDLEEVDDVDEDDE